MADNTKTRRDEHSGSDVLFCCFRADVVADHAESIHFCAFVPFGV